MKSQHIQKVIEHYTPNVAKNRAGYQILDWSSRDAQFTRFDVLRQEMLRCHLDRDPAILDVGCGIAELHGFLRDNGISTIYTGVEITPAVLREAQRRNPHLTLKLADVFSEPPAFPDNSFDVVYCSGIFNLRQDNSLAFARSGIRRLAALTRHLAIANFLHIRTALKYNICVYFKPDDILTALDGLNINATVKDDYLENDFSIIITKGNTPK